MQTNQINVQWGNDNRRTIPINTNDRERILDGVFYLEKLQKAGSTERLFNISGNREVKNFLYKRPIIRNVLEGISEKLPSYFIDRVGIQTYVSADYETEEEYLAISIIYPASEFTNALKLLSSFKKTYYLPFITRTCKSSYPDIVFSIGIQR